MDSLEQQTQKVEQFWDNFAEAYSNFHDKNASVFLNTLLNMIKIEQSDYILEVGCGAAPQLPLVLGRKKPSAIYYATDLSNNLLQKGINRFYEFSKRFGKEFTEIPQIKQELQIPLQKLIFKKIDAQNMIEFKDAQFDTILGNLCLQLVPEPQRVLQETSRVCKLGGRVGFTVWGRPEQSLFFTLIGKVLKSLNIQPPQQITDFHLNSKEKLIEMFEASGFGEILIWNQFNPFSFTDPSDIDLYVAQSLKQVHDQTTEVKKEFESLIRKETEQLIQVDKSPMGLDGLLIIAKKVK